MVGLSHFGKEGSETPGESSVLYNDNNRAHCGALTKLFGGRWRI